MTDPSRPIKNPNRVPMSLQLGAAGDPIGTAGVNNQPSIQIVRGTPATTQESSDMSFKRNRETGAFEVAVDGNYQNPATKDSFQFRKGHVVPEDVARTFKRIGPWPDEPDELAIEAAATNKSGTNPLNNDPVRPANNTPPTPVNSSPTGPASNDPKKPEDK